jgi:hypothetical protein
MAKALFHAGILVLLLSAILFPADIDGTWIIKMKGLESEEEMEMVIKASGEKLKIKAQHPMFDEMSGTGRLKGDTIKFKLDSKEMPMTIEFTGKIVGNRMSGTRKMQTGGGPGGWGGPDGPGGGPGGPGGPDGMGSPMETNQIPKEWTAEKQ